MNYKICMIPDNDIDVRQGNALAREIKSSELDFQLYMILPFPVRVGTFTDKEINLDLWNIYKVNDFEEKNAYSILQKIKPDVIIFSNDQSPYERSFLIASKVLDIKSLFLQSGAFTEFFKIPIRFRITRNFLKLLNPIGTIVRYHFLFKTYRKMNISAIKALITILLDIRRALKYDLRGKYGCDRFLVTGQYDKNLLINRGIPEKIITVTGNPNFDYLTEIRIKRERKIKNKSTLTKIGLVGSGYPSQSVWTYKKYSNYINTIINAIHNVSNKYEIFYKPHYTSDPNKEKKYFKKFLNKISFLEDINIHKFISDMDIVILCTHSTAGLEAMFLGVPVITLNFYDEPTLIPYSSCGILEANSPSDLTLKINKLSNDDNFFSTVMINQRKAIEYFACSDDGLSSKRVIKCITETIEGET